MAPTPTSDTNAGGPITFWDSPRTFFWGRSQGENANLHDAIAAAVDKAGLDGASFAIVYSEVESVGDPNVGSYNVILTPGT